MTRSPRHRHDVQAILREMHRQVTEAQEVVRRMDEASDRVTPLERVPLRDHKKRDH